MLDVEAALRDTFAEDHKELDIQISQGEQAIHCLFGPWAEGSFEYFGCKTFGEYIDFLKKIEPEECFIDAKTHERSMIRRFGSIANDSKFQNAFFAATMVKFNTLWAQRQGEVLGLQDSNAVDIYSGNISASRRQTEYFRMPKHGSDVHLNGPTKGTTHTVKKAFHEDRSFGASIASSLPPHFLLAQLAETCREQTAHMDSGACAGWMHISKDGLVTAANAGDTLQVVFLRNRATGKITTHCLSIAHNFILDSDHPNHFEEARYRAQNNAQPSPDFDEAGWKRNEHAVSRAFGDRKFRQRNSNFCAQVDTTQMNISEMLQTHDAIVLSATDGLTKWITAMSLGKILEHELANFPSDKLDENVSEFFARICKKAAEIYGDDTTLQWTVLNSPLKEGILLAAFDGHGGQECAEKLLEVTSQFIQMNDSERLDSIAYSRHLESPHKDSQISSMGFPQTAVGAPTPKPAETTLLRRGMGDGVEK